MKLDQNGRMFLLSLFQAEKPVDVSFLFQRYGIRPSQIFSMLKNFQSEGLIEVDGHLLSLTDVGREWVRKRAPDLMAVNEKPWRRVPDEFSRERSPPFQPYVPRLKNRE